MITLLRRLFIENWQRKLVSLVLSMIVWMVVNHSMTTTRIIHNIPVKIKNVSKGKTIDGLQSNGSLNKRISLTITGNKSVVDNLSGNDVEVVLDANGKEGEWIATISKHNLHSLNPNLDLQTINKIAQHDFIVRTSNLVTEKVPVIVSKPIGEAPKGYQFLDVWPYKLHLSLTGPEEMLKKLKTRGIKLTFNLNEISREELDSLKELSEHSDEVSYLVPKAWKKISLPQLSETPFEIDDPQVKHLRIDFVKRNLIPMKNPIPVALFFQNKYSDKLNPEKYSLEESEFIHTKNGIKVINSPLYAKGVSRDFAELVEDMLQIVIVVEPKKVRKNLLWTAQIAYPQQLEDTYVDKIMSDHSDEIHSGLHPRFREEYLRNRFRNYMNQFRLFTPDDEKLSLNIELKGKEVAITPQNTLK